MTSKKSTDTRAIYPLGIAAVLSLLAVSDCVTAAGPRALPANAQPDDVRLGPLKDLNGYFPFVVPENREAWNIRAASLRRQVLVSQGLWPMPTRHPLQPVVHGRVEKDDYTVDKVFFESMPGFYVTGNLYRPKAQTGKLPGVLCPHGHWSEGRFYDAGRDSVRKQIVQGAERFEDGGRSPMQSRSVQLARMGCIVFHYDMIGYADSQQIPREIIHGFQKQRAEMNAPRNWGLFSPQAESRLQSSMGLQTFNSIRSLDFLTSLPDVDTTRIAITGASGGGTQSFVLASIDPRVTVAFPAVMVSTAMQGGCTCENACCLRVGHGNIELAALFAPKPLGLTAANDWTLEMPTKGFPELKRLYKLLSAPNNVELTALPHFGHNYNYVSRAAMYHWLNKHLKLGLEEPIVEEQYERLPQSPLTVWNLDHPQPKGGPDFERQLLSWWNQDSQQQLDRMLPTDIASCQQYQQTVGQGIDAILARRLPQPNHVDLRIVSQKEHEDYRTIVGLLTYRLPEQLAVAANQTATSNGVQEQIPLVLLQPTTTTKRVCVMAMPQGKAGLFDEDGVPHAAISRLLEAGVSVCAADLLFQGEFLADSAPITKTRRVENRREAAAYTFGYNPSLLAQRAHDLLSVIALFDREDYHADQIDLVGLGPAGPWTAVAFAQAKKRVARLAIDNADFRFAEVDDLHSPMFLPGGAKYHDLPGIMALAAPKPLWLAQATSALPAPVAAAYQAYGEQTSVTFCSDKNSNKLEAVVQWLLE